MDFLAVCRGGIQVFRLTVPNSEAATGSTIAPTLGAAQIEKVKQWAGAEEATWSNDGKWLAFGSGSRITLCGGASLEEEKSFILPAAVKHLVFSPCSQLLLTCSRSHPENDAVSQLWDIETGKELFGQSIKSIARQWPSFVWSGQETFAFQSANQKVRIFDSLSRNFTDPVAMLPLENVIRCVPSPEIDNRCFLAVFSAPPPTNSLKGNKSPQYATPGAGGFTAPPAATGTSTRPPAAVTVYDISALKETVATGDYSGNLSELIPAPVGRKTLGSASDAEISWNTEGSAILILAQYEVDEAHKFYEGSSSLHFMRMPEAKATESKAVAGEGKTLDKGGALHYDVVAPRDGPVHDVRWSPKFNEFVISNGPMPPQLKLCSGRTGEGKLSFGKTRRNTLRFNPFGRLLAFGGFGNLPGDLDIWDKNKKECIGSTKASCTVECDWAPDGRHLLASTTNPRLRVDNCIRVYHYSGHLRARVDFDSLFHARWRPVPNHSYPDLPPTPGRASASVGAATQSQRSAAGGAAAPNPAAYRPPGSSGVLAARMRAEREREQQQHASVLRQQPVAAKTPARPPGGQRQPPGSAPLPKSKGKKKGGGGAPPGGAVA